MKLIKALHIILKWTARGTATLIIILCLPFYFGYGNPLPFIDPDHSTYTNTWLTIFPFMFIGLGLGWKFERIGGLLAAVPILAGFIITGTLNKTTPLFMLVPVLVGVMYIFAGLTREKAQRALGNIIPAEEYFNTHLNMIEHGRRT